MTVKASSSKMCHVMCKRSLLSVWTASSCTLSVLNNLCIEDGDDSHFKVSEILCLKIIFFVDRKWHFRRAGFSWWEAGGPRGVGSSLKLGSRSRRRRRLGVGRGEGVSPSLLSEGSGEGTVPLPRICFTLWCINA